jgi:hypothetical protein
MARLRAGRRLAFRKGPIRRSADVSDTSSSESEITLMSDDETPIRSLSIDEISNLFIGARISRIEMKADGLRLSTSDGVYLSLPGGQNGSLSILNSDFPKHDLNLVGRGFDADIPLVDHRLKALNTIYTISFLLNNNMEEALSEAVTSSTELDNILRIEDRLYIDGASSGSFWLTIFAKTKSAYDTIKGTLLLLVPEGRSTIRIRIKAETKKQEYAAKSAGLKVEKQKFDLAAHRTSTLILLLNKIDKIKDPEVKTIVRKSVVTGLAELGIPMTPMADEAVQAAAPRELRASRKSVREKPASQSIGTTHSWVEPTDEANS